MCVLAVFIAAAAACTTPEQRSETPQLAPRDTVFTTVQPTRQDVTNQISLSGRVMLNPVFGVVAPVDGQVRYLDVKAPTSTPTKPTRVATVWAKGKAHHVSIPAGAVFAGRLMDDRSTVTAGMPIASARHIGYGIVAEIGGDQAYRISESLGSVQAQIHNGPGPFPCSVLGTIAALPPGTIPDPPAPLEPAQPVEPTGMPLRPGPPMPDPRDEIEPSEATGLRVVCTAPPDVKLINGATATLEVVTARVANALVLPVEAVAGMHGNGKVDVVRPDGTRETRDVVLGLTDGKVVEIKSGLTGDETIAVPGPNLPPADSRPDTGPGVPGIGK